MGGRGVSSEKTIRQQRTFDGKTFYQGIGNVDAYRVENLKKGDVIMYNYGYTSKVKSVEPTPSGKSYRITTISSKSKEEHTKTYRTGTLLGISSNEARNEKEVRINALRNKLKNR